MSEVARRDLRQFQRDVEEAMSSGFDKTQAGMVVVLLTVEKGGPLLPWEAQAIESSRQEARTRKDFGTADHLRGWLAGAGFRTKDQKT